MITVNATVVTVWLDSWGDGGCGILYFVIEYREHSHSQVYIRDLLNFIKLFDKYLSQNFIFSGKWFLTLCKLQNECLV